MGVVYRARHDETHQEEPRPVVPGKLLLRHQLLEKQLETLQALRAKLESVNNIDAHTKALEVLEHGRDSLPALFEQGLKNGDTGKRP